MGSAGDRVQAVPEGPPQAPTSVKMMMAAFLSRSSRLCRLGSSWKVSALTCLQWFCTMALGTG